MKLLLTRHGETSENLAGITMGQNPGHLTAHGRSEAVKLRQKLQAYAVDAVYTSDLARCVVTAEILTADMDALITYEPRLRETDFGVYQGQPYSAINYDYAGHPEQPFPGGESNMQLLQRVIDALNDIYDHHGDQTVLIVSHSGPIAVILAAARGLRFRDALQNKVAHNDLSEVVCTARFAYPVA